MPTDPLDKYLPPSLQGTEVEDTPFNQAEGMGDITDAGPGELVEKSVFTTGPHEIENPVMVSARAGWTFLKFLYPEEIVIPWAAGKHDEPEIAYFEIPLSLEQIFEKVFISSYPNDQKILWVDRFKRINRRGIPEIRPQYQNLGVPGIAFTPNKCTCLPTAVANLFFQHGGAVFQDAGNRVSASELAKSVPQMVSAEPGWTFAKYLFPEEIVIPWPAEEHEDSKVAYFEIPPSLEQLFEKVFITEAPGSPKIILVNRHSRIDEETGQQATRPEYENKGVPGRAFTPDKYTCIPTSVAELFFKHGQKIFHDASPRVPASELARRVPRRSDDGFYLAREEDLSLCFKYPISF